MAYTFKVLRYLSNTHNGQGDPIPKERLPQEGYQRALIEVVSSAAGDYHKTASDYDNKGVKTGDILVENIPKRLA